MNECCYSQCRFDYLSTLRQFYVRENICVGNYSMSTFCKTSASRPVFGTSSAFLKMKESLPQGLSAYPVLCEKSMQSIYVLHINS